MRWMPGCWMLLLWITPLSHVAGSDALNSVVRLRAVDHTGGLKLGSAVAIGADRVVTACHVVRNAQTIEVMQAVRKWSVTAQVGSVAHDLCILTVPNLALNTPHRRASGDLNIGDSVIAVGYPGNGSELVAKQGSVLGVYEFDGGRVIRTDAAFDFGASGGALFDEHGNLVGVLAFKARAMPSARFALPTEWIGDDGSLAAQLKTRQAGETHAFWERPQAARPEFLGVALRESLAAKY